MLKKYTVDTIRNFKNKKKIVATTAYDFTMARLINSTKVDLVLVGDSLGNVICGHENTLSVSLNQIIYHTQCVEKGLDKAFLVSDMPFLSYSVSLKDSLRNIKKLFKKTKTQAIKLEGAYDSLYKLIRVLKDIGIPVMGHIGYTPQFFHEFGYKIRSKTSAQKDFLIEAAQKLEDLGVFSIVLEMVPQETSAEITKLLKIPSIGIGSGLHCDGQILVSYDLLGMNLNFKAGFVRQYSQSGQEIINAFNRYGEDVEEKKFPNSQESF